MTEPITPPGNAPRPDGADDSSTSSASQLFDSIREAVEDLAERAAPAVKQFSVKAAELAADAADKAAPLARRAGAATAEASGKLAEKSRGWASDHRRTRDADPAADGADGAASTAEATTHATADADPPADAATDDDANAGR